MTLMSRIALFRVPAQSIYLTNHLNIDIYTHLYIYKLLPPQNCRPSVYLYVFINIYTTTRAESRGIVVT